MKTTLLAFIFLASGTVFADETILCVDREIQDSTFSANFILKQTSSTVDLFIPDGETSGKTVSGECRRDEGAIELAITCNVMTSANFGFKVKLFSIGGTALHATVTPWSMTGDGQPITLPCDK